MNIYIVLFQNTHQVLKAESTLKSFFENVTTIPTPEQLSTDCGVSLQIKTKKSTKEAEKIFAKKNITYTGLAMI